MADVGTLRQFEAAHRAEFLADAGGVSGAEYDRCYPAGSRLHEWSLAVVEQARGGRMLSARVLDDVLRFRRRPGVPRDRARLLGGDPAASAYPERRDQLRQIGERLRDAQAAVSSVA